MNNVVLKIIQLSDLHISPHRNLLAPMVDQINREEDVDVVVITGDTVHKPNKETFIIATEAINRIRHKVVVLPGDYDNGDLWSNTFGDRYKHLHIGGYNLEFLDTSFLGHRFAVGWGDTLKSEDKDQYEWLNDKLNLDGYHMLFSHHPFLVSPSDEKHEFFRDNIRAVYSGHLHETFKFYFKYTNPRRTFGFGFGTVGLKFHGNMCYLLILVGDNDEITNIPRVLGSKKTAWN